MGGWWACLLCTLLFSSDDKDNRSHQNAEAQFKIFASPSVAQWFSARAVTTLCAPCPCFQLFTPRGFLSMLGGFHVDITQKQERASNSNFMQWAQHKLIMRFALRCATRCAIGGYAENDSPCFPLNRVWPVSFCWFLLSGGVLVCPFLLPSTPRRWRADFLEN